MLVQVQQVSAALLTADGNFRPHGHVVTDAMMEVHQGIFKRIGVELK